MTDEQIKEALKCCLNSGERCNKCELNGSRDCIALHPKDILDLINRQKAEIERLKPFEKKVLESIVKKIQIRNCPFSPFDEYCTGYCVNCENRLECVDCSKRLKVEGAKELARELKMHCSDITSDNINEPNVRILWDAEEIIDDVVKEMVGEQNGDL